MTISDIEKDFMLGNWDDLIELADMKFFNGKAFNRLVGETIKKCRAAPIQLVRRRLAWELVWKEAMEKAL